MKTADIVFICWSIFLFCIALIMIIFDYVKERRNG